MLRRIIVHITVQFGVIAIAVIMLLTLPIMLVKCMVNKCTKRTTVQNIQLYLEVHDKLRDVLKDYLELTLLGIDHEKL
jgi:ABC-type transport system involved in cytochrome bd biosynthesis fused ATPase/permease subunit